MCNFNKSETLETMGKLLFCLTYPFLLYRVKNPQKI